MYGMDFSKINGKTLLKFYRDQFSLYFEDSGINVPTQTLKDIAIMARLIQEQGQKEAVEIVDFACENWDRVKKEGHINSAVPLPNIIYGFRFNIMTMLGKQKTKDLVYIEPTEVKHKSVDARDIF